MMTMKELNVTMKNATTDATTVTIPDIYKEWIPAFVSNVIDNTFGNYHYSATVTDVGEHYIKFKIGNAELYIAMNETFTSENEKCVCWELRIMNGNTTEHLSNGYTVINTLECVVVDCIMG